MNYIGRILARVRQAHSPPTFLEVARGRLVMGEVDVCALQWVALAEWARPEESGPDQTYPLASLPSIYLPLLLPPLLPWLASPVVREGQAILLGLCQVLGRGRLAKRLCLPD